MISSTLRSEFLLRKDINFLNFGSFGATPRPIFDRYQAFQLELEQEPVQFIVKTGMEYLKQSRVALGKYLNVSADDLVYLPNPSHAVNLIAKSFDLKPGDEVLTTEWEYGACDRTFDFYCKKSGATLVRQQIPLPIMSKEYFMEHFVKGITPKTKLIFMNHITSSTGLRFPVEEVIAYAKSKGIPTFIDGAHAPGQIPLDLTALGAEIYTGACHKWMMTPKGSSFLYVKKEWQDRFDPLVVSWGYNSTTPSHSKFLDYHQTQGTRDFSAFLCIPEAIAFMEKYDWPSVAKECRELVRSNAPRFLELLGAEPIAPITDDFILQLYSTPIRTTQPAQLKDLLFEKYKIEVPVMPHGDKVFLRYSIQAFNTQEDLDGLYEALKEIKSTTDLIG
jgi:isopenicillin-N epimerase